MGLRVPSRPAAFCALPRALSLSRTQYPTTTYFRPTPQPDTPTRLMLWHRSHLQKGGWGWFGLWGGQEDDESLSMGRPARQGWFPADFVRPERMPNVLRF